MKIGKVTHYFDKISVAIVALDAALKKGDKIRFERGGEEMFTQTVESMQVDHKEIESAKKGDEIGLKVDKEVREGAEVFQA